MLEIVDEKGFHDGQKNKDEMNANEKKKNLKFGTFPLKSLLFP